MTRVLEYLAAHGATYQADLMGPCGTALEVEGEVTRLIGEGLVRKNHRSRLQLTKRGVAKLNGDRALEIKPQGTLPRLAELVEDLSEDKDSTEIFVVLRDFVGAVIQIRVADLIGSSGDLKLLSDIHHKLARRADQ